MKVSIVEVPSPMFTSFTLFADLDRELLKTEKKVTVSFHKATETRVSTSMQIGDYKTKINIYVDGYKFATKNAINMMSGKYEESCLFKKLKSQDFAAYKEYLAKLMVVVFQDYLKIELDELTVELEMRSF